jgi:hypothetical protein
LLSPAPVTPIGGCSGLPKRNGGRHCCQPPLRRAKDLPVFVTWLIEPFGLPTRSRSWLTSSGVASHRTVPSTREEPDQSTGLRLPKVRLSFDRPGLASEPKPFSQNRPMLCGPSWVDHSCVPLRSPTQSPRGRSSREPRRAREDQLFRRLFPAGPDKNPKALTIACRRRSELRDLPPEGGSNRRPDHMSTMHLVPESQKQNFW